MTISVLACRPHLIILPTAELGTLLSDSFHIQRLWRPVADHLRPCLGIFLRVACSMIPMSAWVFCTPAITRQTSGTALRAVSPRILVKHEVKHEKTGSRSSAGPWLRCIRPRHINGGGRPLRNDCSTPYATSTSSSPCTFVRAMSVACAQFPRNTTVTRPCVLLPVGS